MSFTGRFERHLTRPTTTGSHLIDMLHVVISVCVQLNPTIHVWIWSTPGSWPTASAVRMTTGTVGHGECPSGTVRNKYYRRRRDTSKTRLYQFPTDSLYSKAYPRLESPCEYDQTWAMNVLFQKLSAQCFPSIALI